MNNDTFPKLLLQNATKLKDEVALREKEFGIWQTVTWGEFADHVRDFALGLHVLGLRSGDTVAIIGDNRPEWLYSELAAQSLGAKSVGIYQDSAANEVKYIVQASHARVVIAEDQEQVDKMLEIWEELDDIAKVIYYYPKGLRNYEEPFLAHFPDIEALGRDYQTKHPNFFAERVSAGKSSDIAILSTTSGTTGRPKLAMLSHKNLISQGKSLVETEGFSPEDEFVSFLPLAWVGEQMITVACGIQVGFTINFPESASTVQDNIREIGPRAMFSPPRIWENMLSTVQVKIQDSTRLKQQAYEWAIEQGREMADFRFKGQEPPSRLKWRYKLANWLVFEPLKDQLGLRHLKRAYTGGAALGPDIFRFYHALGVNLKQVYGQTECSGLSVIHRNGDIKAQSVGVPLPNAEVKIDPDSGEILVRGDSVFVGYYNNEKATAETLVDKWLHSGDAGYFDKDGHLVVIDRAKDVMTLHDGTKFSPQFIENKLKFSLYIKEAVVFGGGSYPFVAAMINIDFENVGKWAENNQISYTTYTDLAQKGPVYDLIRKEVERTNADLDQSAARIIRYLLLHKELDADDAELTRTRKVRRGFVAQRYQEIVDALYGSEDSLYIDSTITYQDGRTANIATTLRVETMNAQAHQEGMARQKKAKAVAVA